MWRALAPTQLIVDRFLAVDPDGAIDLATGLPVLLRIDRIVDQARQLQWAARCDALQKLHFRFLAPLVDYGALGPFERFEAWSWGAPWRGTAAEAQRAIAATRRWFEL